MKYKQGRDSTYSSFYLLRVILLCFGFVAIPSVVFAQKASLFDVEKVYCDLKSLPHSNNTDTGEVAYIEKIRFSDASWIRIEFENVHLNQGDSLLIRSHQGNQEQIIGTTDPQYGGRIVSIIFDGGDVDVELHLAPGSQNAEFTIDKITVAHFKASERTICGNSDDRALFDDPCALRIVDDNGGWGTGFMIGDNCMITAHHVMTFPPWTVQRNVPASDATTGDINNPGAADQFTVANLDNSTTSGHTVRGDDWAVVIVPNNASGALGVGCNPTFNCNYENTTDGANLTIDGFGLDDENERNGVLQQGTGPSVAGGVNTNHFRYRVDTRANGSGSRVIDNSGRIVGIHTNGGCNGDDPETGSNSGTLIKNPDLVDAIDDRCGMDICQRLAVVFIMDITGSTGALLPNWQAQMPNVITDIQTAFPGSRFGLVSHLDYPFSPYSGSGEWAFRLESPLNDDPAPLLTALTALVNGWGADTPESQYEAIYQTLTGEGRDLNGDGDFSDVGEIMPSDMNFAPASDIIIFHFTWPPIFHDRDTEPNYPFPGSAPVAGRTATINALLAKPVIFFGLITSSGKSDTISPQTGEPFDDLMLSYGVNQLQELADTTGGAVLYVGSDLSGLDSAIAEAIFVIDPRMELIPDSLDFSPLINDTVYTFDFAIVETSDSFALESIDIFTSDMIDEYGNILPSSYFTFTPSHIDTIPAGGSALIQGTLSVPNSIIIDLSDEGNFKGSITVEGFRREGSIRLTGKAASFGTMSISVTDDAGPLMGVAVDIYNANGDLVDGGYTDDEGYFSQPNLRVGTYTAAIVPPLGYFATDTEMPCQVLPNDTNTVEFILEPMPIEPTQQSSAYWKHVVAGTYYGTGDDSLTQAYRLPFLADLIYQHFQNNRVHPVPLFGNLYPGTGRGKVMALLGLLGGKVPVHDTDDVIIDKEASSHASGLDEGPWTYKLRATRELTALLLNIVTEKLATFHVAAEDGITVSQVITYTSDIIYDPDSTNDRSSYLMLRELNYGRTLAAGSIPDNVPDIAYMISPSVVLPGDFALYQNYPNPFNPATTMSFTLPVATDYQLVVFNIMGQVVSRFSGHAEAGLVEVEWDGTDYSSGIYLYKLTAGNFTETRKMVLLK